MKTALQKKIFIVDDDPLWSIKMSEILSNLGYTNILRFESGEDCVNNLHQHPAVIFLDFTMKAMDGLQVLKKAKDYLPGIDIIFCTANKDLGLAVKAMKSGSNVFLIKQHATEGKIRTVLESFTTDGVVALG